MRKHLRVVRLRVLFFALNERRSWARKFEVSPAGSVVAPAKQGHPQDDRNPSRAFYKKESKRVLFFSLNERRSWARRFEVSPAGSVVVPALNGIFSFFK